MGLNYSNLKTEKFLKAFRENDALFIGDSKIRFLNRHHERTEGSEATFSER